jgi:hypothetical protein
LNEDGRVKTISIFFRSVAKSSSLQPRYYQVKLEGRTPPYNPLLQLWIVGASPYKKKGTYPRFLFLWPRKCFFPYARLRYGLHYTFGEEREPSPLLRLYILHFHSFYGHVDLHVVMSNTKKAFQF